MLKNVSEAAMFSRVRYYLVTWLPHPVFETNQYIVQKMNCRLSIKFLYQVLKEKEFIAPKLKRDKWESCLGETISEKLWKVYYEKASNCTKETKLIYFHYRIVNIIHNYFLHKKSFIQSHFSCVFF
jgi:hypothetical protein